MEVFKADERSGGSCCGVGLIFPPFVHLSIISLVGQYALCLNDSLKQDFQGLKIYRILNWKRFFL